MIAVWRKVQVQWAIHEQVMCLAIFYVKSHNLSGSKCWYHDLQGEIGLRTLSLIIKASEVGKKNVPTSSKIDLYYTPLFCDSNLLLNSAGG